MLVSVLILQQLRSDRNHNVWNLSNFFSSFPAFLNDETNTTNNTKRPNADGLSAKLHTQQLALSTTQSENASKLHKFQLHRFSQLVLKKKLSTVARAAKELQTQAKEFQSQNTELKQLVDQVEVERNFYFQKLREIEILIDQELAKEGDVNRSFLKTVQSVMYKA